MVKVIGCDLSLNHSAFVELIDGELSRFRYFTNIVGSAKRSKEHGTRMPLFKGDKQTQQMRRLAWIKKYVRDVILPMEPDYVGIEDYALSMSHNSHYLGEGGGIIKTMFFERGIKMRLHDPLSVKMFATHKGNSEKSAMELAVADRWYVSFAKYNAIPSKSGVKKNRQTSEDLADAFCVAQLVWLEIKLRAGLILLESLHPKEIQVFNRVTKMYPNSLLSREWIEANSDV